MTDAKKPTKKRATKKKAGGVVSVPVADDYTELFKTLAKEAEARAENFIENREGTQPGMPVGVPYGHHVYGIPADITDERKIAIRADVIGRGYFRDPTGQCVYPDLPGCEVYLCTESVALKHWIARKAKSDALREEASGRKKKRSQAEIEEGITEAVLTRMQALKE